MGSEDLPAQGVPSFATDSDDDLLGYMAMREEDFESAREAWAELFRRHSKYLYNVLISRFGGIPGTARTLEEVVQNTFCLAFERASTFTSLENRDSDGERRRVRAWLGKIAEHAFKDTLRRDRSIQADFSTEEVPDLVAPVVADSESDARLVVEEALGTLSEREQDVVRVTMQYFSPGAEQQRLPNAVSTNLAAAWNTTPQNIRAIRHRAFMKIKKYIAGKSQSVPTKKGELQ
ncbi:MAG: sigma-70 family RNA polymerase sigma factor [Acidobacteriota bacterium]|nr:sigma-70 family RNA polymerase sigma factor [Acidobacteriota bacterium]